MRKCGALAGRFLLPSSIEQLDQSGERDLDVRRFEIAIDDALLVHGVEPVGNLAGAVESFGDWNAGGTASRDPLGKRQTRLRFC